MPFWDNDSLAALLAIELKADLLLLMTDVNGLYTGPPADPASEYALLLLLPNDQVRQPDRFRCVSRIMPALLASCMPCTWPLAAECPCLSLCRVIHSYCPAVHDKLIKFGNKSGGGRGGMTAKVQPLFHLAAMFLNCLPFMLGTALDRSASSAEVMPDDQTLAN